MSQNRERFNLKKSMHDRIKEMTNRKNLKKILSNTQDLNDFLAFSQEQIDYVESDNESSQGEN